MECNFENCGYYTDGECNICGMGISGEDTFCRLCKDNPKCYYKQLAELKAENEKLKALCDTYRTCYQAKHSDIKCLFIKYKQTLQEIKAIAKDMYEDYSKRWDDNISEGLEQIIDLITKVEEE